MSNRPSFREQLGAAVAGRPFRRERKETTTMAAIVPYGAQAARWTQVNYENAAREGYGKNPYVYAAIRQNSMSVAGIKWNVYADQTKKKKFDDHPALTLITRPNPREGKTKFFENMMGYLLLDGNSFLQAIGPTVGPPRELYVLRPDRVKIVVGTQLNPITGYIYALGNVKVPMPTETIRHFKLFNPLDDWRGMSPMSAAAMSVDQSNASKAWNVSLLQNGARPTGAMVAQGKLDPVQYARLRELIQEEYTGFANAGFPLLLEGGVSWEEMGINPKDMDWLEGQRQSSREIAIVYNIAPELIGDSSNKTYSNYKEARQALIEENTLPTCDWIRDELNAWLSPMFEDDPYFDYDKDDIEALQEDRDAVWTRVDEGFKSGWVSMGEAQEQVGIDVDVKYGKKYIWQLPARPVATPPTPPGGGAGGPQLLGGVRVSELPNGANGAGGAGSTGTGTGTGKNGETGAEGKSPELLPGDKTPPKGEGAAEKTPAASKATNGHIVIQSKARPQDAKAYVRGVQQARNEWVTRTSAMFAKQFASDQVAVKSAVRSDSVKNAEAAITRVLTSSAVRTEWTNLYVLVLTHVGQDSAEKVMNHLSDQTGKTLAKSVGDDANEAVLQWVARYAGTRVDAMLGSTARRMTAGLYTRQTKSIQAGTGGARPAHLDANDTYATSGSNEYDPLSSPDSLAYYLDDAYSDLIDSGSDVLAEYEAVQAGNAGSQLGAETVAPVLNGTADDGTDMGDLEKVWQATHDDKTREDHAEADGQSVNISEPFEVGGEEMMWPMDDSLGATPGNTRSCRCVSFFSYGAMLGDDGDAGAAESAHRHIRLRTLDNVQPAH